ncbi:hypothetical protein LguiA_010593 [Lonicera macranthoides]
MSSRVFKGCRALMAAAKAATPKSSSTAKKKTATKPVSSITTTKAVKPPKAAARPTGILKLSPVSPALHDFLGVPEISRTDAVKKTWEYIKLHNLQNPTNKREIHCDEKLKTIFDGKDKVGFLEIAKYLSHHFVKTD